MRKRSRAREYAIQILYQFDMTGDPIDLILQRFWKDRNPSGEIKAFSIELIKGTIENIDEIDSIINNYSENWSIDRMPVVDRNILRSAIYEILYIDDVPPKVTIDEALDLANRFSTPNSAKFINGILDKLIVDRLKSYEV